MGRPHTKHGACGMEVKNACESFLADYEVYTFIQTEQKRRTAVNEQLGALIADKKKSTGERSKIKERQRKNVALDTIIYEVNHCMQELPCRSQTPDAIKDFLDQCRAYGLTKSEKLQLLNLRPKSLVEIHLLVEECEDRLTDEQSHSLLALIVDVLPVDARADA